MQSGCSFKGSAMAMGKRTACLIPAWLLAIALAGHMHTAPVHFGPGNAPLQALRADEFLPSSFLPSSQPKQPATDAHSLYEGSLSCASAACHGRIGQRFGRFDRSRDEWTRWMRNDPHARARHLLDSDAFHALFERYVHAASDTSARRERSLRCAPCHDPRGMNGDLAENDPNRDSAPAEPRERGIGCETCHGPSRPWVAAHVEPHPSRANLRQLGFIDNQPLVERARQCATCHVGTSTADVDHDMIAAGHPELYFEFSSYHARLPKHWSSVDDRLATEHFELQSWLAGQVACLQAALELRIGRADRARHNKQIGWPDFAEQSCFSCHQRIRPADRSPSRTPPLRHAELAARTWNPWHRPIHDQIIEYAGLPPLDSNDPTFWRPMVELTPATLPQQGETLIATLRRAAVSTTLVDSPLQPRQLLAWLRDSKNAPSWEHACQQVLAVSALERSWDDELAIAVRQSRLSESERDQYRDQTLSDRRLLQELRQALTYADGRRFPAIIDPLQTSSRSPGQHYQLSDVAAAIRLLVEHWESHGIALPARPSPNQPEPFGTPNE